MARKIDLSELSKRLGVSRYLIGDWLKLGLPYKKTSRGYKFDYDQVVDWHDSHVKRVIGKGVKNDGQRTV